jgi:chloride channel protein, CIC family
MQKLAISQALHRLLPPKALAILEACMIGLVSALAAVLLKQSIAWVEAWRSSVASQLSPWIALPLIGIGGGFLSGILLERLAPEASGSGIPQVKAALSYAPIALDLRVAIAKLLGTTLVVGSGLAVGRQGPTVQIGAALAAQLSHWVETSPTYQRQLIAAGAAAGLAAGFNAPIAGILFVVEELLQDFSDFTLGTAILASFVGGVVSRLLGGQGLIPDLHQLQVQLSGIGILLLILLGAVTGILGGLFSRGILASLAFNRYRLRTLTLPWRISLAGGITGIVVAFFPPMLQSSLTLQDVLITGGLSWQLTGLIFLAKFLLILIAYGSGAPGGLFAPSLVLGAALGGLFGAGVQTFQPSPLLDLGLGSSSSTVFALAGMGAFFSAVTRGPVTAIVIVFEMTTNFGLVLPLMISSVVAYLVAEQVFSGSIYKHLLEWGGLQVDEKAPADQRWEGLTAADIMQPRVETLASGMMLAEALQAFTRSHHRGFPVVEKGQLVGILTQTDLAKASTRQLSAETPLSQLMTTQLVTVGPTDALTHVLYLLNRYQVSRLPVTDGRKLIGIITRADIIRAESDQVSGDSRPLGPKPEPSYVVYQTRAPATGRGRLLVPLSNPKTATILLRLAAAIARDRHYELECLQVIVIPRHQAPTETAVDLKASLKLLAYAVQCGYGWEIPVHTQVRVAHDATQAILETIKERHIDLLLMGWKGYTSSPGRIFGDTVDTAIRQAACDMMLVKLAQNLFQEASTSQWLARSSPSDSMRVATWNRWLVPIAGGPNAQYAVHLLPALIKLSIRPDVKLCQVFHPNAPIQDTTTLESDVDYLRQRLNVSVLMTPVCAASVPEAIVDMAQKDQCDVIVLGASREGLLQQVLQGNIPEAIAHNCNCTVILVRKATS